MAVTLNASTTAGLVTSADTSGNLDLQAGGVTKIAVTSAGVAVTGLSKASLPTGSVLQVVNSTYATFVSTISATYADTGLTATITPTASTSKILVFVSCNGVGKNTSASATAALKLVRNSTSLFIMDEMGGFTNTTTINSIGSISTTYLDSPATTSATIYKVQIASPSGSTTAVMNNYNTANGNTTSSITLMEIAA